MSITSEAKEEVERLLLARQKLKAISYVRQTFQVNLADAKRLVEAVELELNSTSKAGQNAEFPNNSIADLAQEVKELLAAGRKIEAVKAVKIRLNTGLKEALNWVENVQREVDPNFSPAMVGRAGCAPLIYKMLSVTFGFIGFSLLGGAVFLYFVQQEAIDNGTRIIATVVELRENADGSSTVAPVIAFDWEGEQRLYVSTYYSAPPQFSVGEEVAIFVNPNDPQDVVIDTFVDRWLMLIILGGIASVFLILTMVFSVKGKRSRRAALQAVSVGGR